MVSKAKNSNRLSDSRKNLTLRQRAAIAVVAVLLVWLAIDLIGIGGNIRFYTKWVECGQKPVVIDYPWPGGSGVDNYYTPQTIKLVRQSPDQFCTPLEAELHGYSSSPDGYRLPELMNQRGDWCRYPGEPKSETGLDIDLCKI